MNPLFSASLLLLVCLCATAAATEFSLFGYDVDISPSTFGTYPADDPAATRFVPPLASYRVHGDEWEVNNPVGFSGLRDQFVKCNDFGDEGYYSEDSFLMTRHSRSLDTKVIDETVALSLRQLTQDAFPNVNEWEFQFEFWSPQEMAKDAELLDKDQFTKWYSEALLHDEDEPSLCRRVYSRAMGEIAADYLFKDGTSHVWRTTTVDWGNENVPYVPYFIVPQNGESRSTLSVLQIYYL